MDFSWTKDQKVLRSQAVKFAQNSNRADAIEADRNCEFSKELWRAYADFGVQGLIVPGEYGGLELDMLSCIAIMEGLGYGTNDNGILFSINAHIWSCVKPILTFGTQKQKEKYLPGLCNGEVIGVHAMTEPETGSDAFNLKTTAVDKGDHYVVNGCKTFITNGDIADVVLVFVRDSQKKENINCLIVEKGIPGFTLSRKIEKMGLRTSPMNQLFFENCIIPKENLLGQEGMGKIIFSHAMDEERAFILSAQIGSMEKQLETCVSYAKTRKQYGSMIFKYQSISNMLADMKVRLETSRLLVYKVASLKAKGENASQFSAIAKLYVSESYVQNSLSAMRIHGGYGYTTEYELERQLRDSVGGLFYSGTSEIMHNIIAELLD
ncbi:MAG: acyl-CoA dehydrogenase family protein [Clostridia bacterium]|nr:acyl-CoA dehydrogenase family protein [Clostridia bacterium]